MKLSVLVLACVCSLCVASCAQQGATAPGVNTKTTKVEVPLSHPTQLIDKATCDSDGNIYVRVWAGDDSGTDRLPVQEITPQGTLTRSFNVEGASHETDLAKGIFVSDAGDLYQAARMANGIYVVKFAKDGSV